MHETGAELVQVAEDVPRLSSPLPLSQQRSVGPCYGYEVGFSGDKPAQGACKLDTLKTSVSRNNSINSFQNSKGLQTCRVSPRKRLNSPFDFSNHFNHDLNALSSQEPLVLRSSYKQVRDRGPQVRRLPQSPRQSPASHIFGPQAALNFEFPGRGSRHGTHGHA